MKSAAETLRATLLAGAALVLGALPLPAFAAGQGPEADYPVLIGDAYAIGGVTYTPADTLNYDAVGYAHAGTEGSGISGAHHTLPIPCYVEVTALDSGKTILVRLDRRGPMTGKQLIELSPAAWAQLGIPGATDAPVRVRRVNPPEPERAALRTGRPRCGTGMGCVRAEPSSLKTATVCTSSLAWERRLPAAAAICSTSAAFCCVTWSIWLTAVPTCATPVACSELAELISPTMSVTRRMELTTSDMVAPA